eukprot:4824195-Alexandrium_andersonii.AAC.1
MPSVPKAADASSLKCFSTEHHCCKARRTHSCDVVNKTPETASGSLPEAASSALEQLKMPFG